MGFLSGITSFVKEHSDVIHGVLDLAGFIPGVGAAADLANAAVYAVEGDYRNAALSVVSAVPGIGDTVALAKKSAKAIKGGVKAMKNMKALTKAEKMKGLFGLLRGKAQTGAKKLAGKAKDLKALFRDLKNGDKKLCLFGKCFTGDTLVYTKKGYVAIREIRKGDDIYSRDADTGETGFKEVEEVFQTGAHTIYHIWLEGKEEIKTTAYHPIYVEERGWVAAINLREGDPVQTMEGTACITRIEKERFEEPVPVYNLHVKDWVSYFVSNMQIYVHNKDILHNKVKGKTNANEIIPDLTTGKGYDAGDVPVRIDGEWSENDMKQALLGHPPKGLGSPDIHHGGQLPGAAKHEVLPENHRTNEALHPNKYNQGVTAEMRKDDKELHWWYRAREQGADELLSDWIYDD